MWWIIGIIVIIAIVGGLAESKDLSTKIMLFASFLTYFRCNNFKLLWVYGDYSRNKWISFNRKYRI